MERLRCCGIGLVISGKESLLGAVKVRQDEKTNNSAGTKFFSVSPAAACLMPVQVLFKTDKYVKNREIC